MPKYFGVNVLGLLLATIVFYLLGALWYGGLFAEQWMSLSHLTEETANANMEKLGVMMWVLGVIITLMQVIGLAMVINWANASKLLTCVKISLFMALFFALPVIAYGTLYEGASIYLLGIDILHLLVGYSLVGAILSYFRSKAS
ncbi:MAG: DUF1761 domain-containing protein [Alcanivoracaceae bacterium]|nr:DUF1761 domain-containing protein [Alcanivoracaceae bacterium]